MKLDKYLLSIQTKINQITSYLRKSRITKVKYETLTNGKSINDIVRTHHQ